MGAEFHRWGVEEFIGTGSITVPPVSYHNCQTNSQRFPIQNVVVANLVVLADCLGELARDKLTANKAALMKACWYIKIEHSDCPF